MPESPLSAHVKPRLKIFYKFSSSRELYEAFALGSVGKEEYLRKKAALSRQKEKLSKEIAQLETGMSSQEESMQNTFADKFKDYLHSEEVPREAVRELLDEVRVYPHGRLEIKWKYQEG